MHKEMIEIIHLYLMGCNIQAVSKTHMENYIFNNESVSEYEFNFEKYVYYSKPALTIPWDNIPKEYKYAAKDEEGSVYVYTYIPTKYEREWLARDEDGFQGDLLSLSDVLCFRCDDAVSWNNSLTVRPKGV